MLFGKSKKSTLVTQEDALAGRHSSVLTPAVHHVFGHDLTMDVPDGFEVAVFGMGCYWGVERIFWQQPGVWLTMVGNAGGYSAHPTYEEVCTGQTGHTEAVRVVYDPALTSYGALLKVFWENHDPTQGMRQGNDTGTQYRSAIYASDADQLAAAQASAAEFGPRLAAQGFGPITTEIKLVDVFYPAEAYHQQYLSKNPAGYCGIGGTGVTCPIGTGA